MESSVRPPPKKTTVKEEMSHKGNPRGAILLSLVLLGATVVHIVAFVSMSVHNANKIASLEATHSQHALQAAARAAVRQEVAVILKRLSDVIAFVDGDVRRQELYLLIDAWAESGDGRERERLKRQTSGDDLEAIFEQMAQRELAIFDRYCGNASKICMPGPQGQNGDTGLQGPKGEVGVQGQKGGIGPQGPVGVKGDLGSPGMQGTQGVPGERGEKGESGVAGTKGTAGEKGDRGDTGATGAKGEQGDRGEIGPVGPVGPAGLKGERGADGAPGPKGDTGQTGSSGPLGPTGSKGDTGADGPAGQKGERGETGPVGAAGPSGPKGETGADGIQGEKGGRGEPGPQGPVGPSGPKGEVGNAGTPGQKGDVGEAGPVGPVGPSGLKGDTGTDGAPGPKGERGEAGPVGNTGQTGPAGEKGDQGTPGSPGQKGDSGEAGPQGPVGAAGAKGERGDDGPPGQNGDRGDVGPEGPAGPPGAKGDTGDPGTPGQRGSTGEKGEKGDRGFDGDVGVPGPKGENGPPGSAGTKGEKGDTGVWSPGMQSCCTALRKPELSPLSSDVKVAEGQPVALTCIPEGFPPATVSWQPAGILNDQRVLVQPNQLLISDVKLSDAGVITCTATNALGETTKTFNLRVLQHLIIASAPQNLTVMEGSPFRLECRFSSEPPPSITWYHVSKNGTGQVVTSGITGDNGYSMLDKDNTRVQDAGKYVCEGTNGLETQRLEEELTVLSKPYITERSANLTVQEGQDVTLFCRSDSLPTPHVHWVYNRIDSHVFEDNRDELEIEDIRKVDGGDYTCTATNKFGSVSATVHIDVQVSPGSRLAPEFTPLKPVLFFDCSVRGDEPLNVTWAKDGVPLDFSRVSKYVRIPDESAGSHRLLMPATSESDIGEYSCQATNYLGSREDISFVYKDLQNVTCDTSFSLCTVAVCGADCPDNCLNADSPVYGNISYSVKSTICRSAIHAGILGETAAGTVVWENTFSSLPFESASVHGIVSLGLWQGDCVAAGRQWVSPFGIIQFGHCDVARPLHPDRKCQRGQTTGTPTIDVQTG